MTFTVLRKAINGLEEKLFYDIALLYLQANNYQELSIVDGPRDGGRDVICSRKDLHIQLSVRKDWQNKINEESDKALARGKSHLMYITNRLILSDEIDAFTSGKYTNKGSVDISVYDASRISTYLINSDYAEKAFEILGMKQSKKISATQEEMAISTTLIFSNEAKETRENAIESIICAKILNKEKAVETEIIGEVCEALKYPNIERDCASAISRLRQNQTIYGPSNNLSLSEAFKMKMQKAETDYNFRIQSDVNYLVENMNITEEDALNIIKLLIELLSKKEHQNEKADAEENINEIISKYKNIERLEFQKEVSNLSINEITQQIRNVERSISLNTFDIYRSLSKFTNITTILDSSVAMPMLFGLAFGTENSRYSLSAYALQRSCKAHNISIVVPRPYINEIAAHGLRALQIADEYELLDKTARHSLRSSENAYLSHFTRIQESGNEKTKNLTLRQFLSLFSIREGASQSKVENAIETLFDQLGIQQMSTVKPDDEIREKIKHKKPTTTASILIDHDAAVCTTLLSEADNGFLFATWDKVILDVLDGLGRAYASTPALITDILSSARGHENDSNINYEVLSALIHCDERKSERLAQKIENIIRTKGAIWLNALIEEERRKHGANWAPSDEDIFSIINNSRSATDEDESLSQDS